MNPRLVEFALRKQRLQFEAERQREQMMDGLAHVESVLDTVDQVRDGVAWAKTQAPILSGTVLVLLATRPRQTFRLARRVWVGWLVYKKLQGSTGSKAGLIALPLLRRLGERLIRRFAAGRA